ncbi:MAG: thiamine-phosphate kinase, partial [Solirubrobacterales bacterium]
MSDARDPVEPRMRHSPEFDLIARVRDRLRSTREASPGGRSGRATVSIGIGDDAAVTVPPAGRGAIAVSVEGLVDGVGFRRRWCPPRSVGRKALGAALSDLAAMGATAGEAYVWLGVPPDFPDADCLALCDGLAELAGELGVAILGGDLTAAPALSVSITVVGYGDSPEALLGRGGAGPGDAVCVTGSFGGAAAGLMILEHPELAVGIDSELRDSLVARQLEPSPRLESGIALARAGASAMIDVSDGLGAEAEHLASASGLGIEIELDRVPVAVGVVEVA